ncbi:MAG: hypothetical protein Q4G48_02390 [Bacteroidia bacterium]|nr:hypothetical protein [Bacteroidia bacterium]
MNVVHLEAESYFKTLRNLSPDVKLELIAKLSKSIKKDLGQPKSVYDFSGKWDSKETAEEIIEDLRKDRVFNRKLEDF